MPNFKKRIQSRLKEQLQLEAAPYIIRASEAGNDIEIPQLTPHGVFLLEGLGMIGRILCQVIPAYEGGELTEQGKPKPNFAKTSPDQLCMLWSDIFRVGVWACLVQDNLSVLSLVRRGYPIPGEDDKFLDWNWVDMQVESLWKDICLETGKDFATLLNENQMPFFTEVIASKLNAKFQGLSLQVKQMTETQALP